jgi:diguanylate cyclase (GGDEF)-like protein/PAS domain S-box-containing protein
MTANIEGTALAGGTRAGIPPSEARFRSLIERAADAVLVIGAQGRVRFANLAAQELFGAGADAAGRDTLVGQPFGIPLAGAQAAEVDVLLPGGARAACELRVIESLWSGEAVWLATLRDVTRRTRMEEALRESEERYALAARASNEGLWDWDLSSGEVYYSPRWKAMLGCSEEEIGARPDEWLERVHAEDVERVRSALRAHVEGLSSHLEAEYRILHRNGSYRWVLCRGLAVRDGQGRATRIAGSQGDVTHRKLAEEQLAHRAFYDPLTNLPNRALFLDRLRHALRRASRRKDYLFAVLFLDIDRFKLINDSLGHMAGDRLLVLIARRLELALRPGDSVARLGGDEFTVLLDDIRDVSDATRVADRIQRELMSPFQIGGQELGTSASIGIALSATGYERPEDILRDADTAMYRAKAQGKARHAMFDTEMHACAVALLKTEADLRHAIERGELRVFYQPIVSLDSGRISGVEALARWIHPERGLVPPSEFIPVAEETGLIGPIGRWVLREACRAVRSWSAGGAGDDGPVLSVNLSSRQLAQPDLVAQIRQTLAEADLDPRRLRLEITESAILEQIESAAATLLELRAIGVGLSIDDFGTGYSSLSYLQKFPFDTLKIDRSFVEVMGEDGERSEIARTIVTIGHNLGKAVIAEGVESPAQLALLRELGCEAAQGYLFSRPVDGDTARSLIAVGTRW